MSHFHPILITLLVLGLPFQLLWLICAGIVSHDANAIIINQNGTTSRHIIISGAIHYTRSTPQIWPDLIQKAKDGGLNAIETDIFWNAHEPSPGYYDFSGNLDFINFFELVQQAGLYAILHIGPYICSDSNLGGLPPWLFGIPKIQTRTDNVDFETKMQNFTTKVVGMLKQENLFASQGGPIILAQIENEYGGVMSSYGEDGKKYIDWAASMAVQLDIGVPWMMSQQSDAPLPVINTCDGFYCDQFYPNNPHSPKIQTQNYVGWFMKWGDPIPHRPVEDLAFSIARFFQNGGVVSNYYMYHGGTNFGRSTGGLYITTSYDFDAPIDEYGNLNQPKWGHLKQLHSAIKLGESFLTEGNKADRVLGNFVNLTTFRNLEGGRFCFLSNSNGLRDAYIDLKQDGKYFVPAWSVSILDGCNKEVFNTAKVNYTQSTKRVMKNISVEEQLSWQWTPEVMDDTLQGKGAFESYNLLYQLRATGDASDYLWYSTRYYINDTYSWGNTTLQVKMLGHVVHVFLNGDYLGSQWSPTGNEPFTFEKPVNVQIGYNNITLLSVTVGLPYYGTRFDSLEQGVDDVKLMGSHNSSDRSACAWYYKVGLNGDERRYFDPAVSNVSWSSSMSNNNVPTGVPMTWYKTSFKTPPGSDPVVVDLQGMGKGRAWVNGQSIGRYWPSFLSRNNGCTKTCDYKGNYGEKKCLWNCGKPTQRWYSVPRSFLSSRDTNSLVLFEEIGGNVSQVFIQTVGA